MPPLTSRRSPSVLDDSLETVRGIGPRVQARLKKLGLNSIEDALYHLPFRYEDRRQLQAIARLRPGRQEVFYGEVLAAGEAQTSRKRRRIYEVIVGDRSGQISLKWFRYRKDWLQKRFPVGQKAVFIGEVKSYGATREVHHPDAELFSVDISMEQLFESDPLNFGRILPVYPLTEGLSQKQFRKIWHDLIERYAPELPSVLPQEILARHNLLPLASAVQASHWPPNSAPLQELEQGRDRWRQSLVFDEFFFLELGLALKRQGVQLEQGIPFNVEHRYTIPLNKMLPFRLTDAQRRVLSEIKQDMMQPHPMHRLLQGDVGSGKTLVALMASLIAIENGYQVALVAPTEILAEQHFLTFEPWLEKLGLQAVLLQGSMTAKARKETLQSIAAGESHLIIGTHAVLQEGVEFHQLGLGIIDEQHRFGVRQRGILKHKGQNPDILVMTATPIPRTLSLTLYGDLAVSVIDQLPPGRKSIETKLFKENGRLNVYSLILDELEKGRQAYVVYPLVEESEKSDLQAATVAAEQLAADIFPRYTVGLLHGRMKSADKEQVMTAFREGQIDILVATTVIEVGVDVPNASVMLIEHADRFGLAQLHQLRGRVGRGAEQSYCLLIPSQQYSEDAGKRLQVMVATNDGFRIAEADLEIRGPGELLGTRQAGLPDFRVANLLRDVRLLETARQEAFNYASQTGYLTDSKSRPVREELLARWGGRLELAATG
ncbi:MAG: ATP-dependent DNA helicase RecG [Desulfuromonadales bacterium]|nr:ATP-dependent DNA helicase RecG [Desulfuromonadales bacterium]